MAAGESNPNQVIHIRQDSDSELQALFDSVLSPNNASSRPRVVPLRLRNLPESFFNPPSSQQTHGRISHSRESSVDSGAGLRRVSPLPAVPQSVHLRAHSSPASLEQTFSLGPQPIISPSGSANNLTDDPLPPGWEKATTPEGRIYFINHITRSTTWEDPRKAQHAQIMAAVATPQAVGTSQQGDILPEGWEQGVTPEGQVYFINHTSRTTSWFDPRLPAYLQRPAVLQSQLNAAAAQAAANPRLHEVRLHQLQLEKERLQMRQQEIKRQMEAEQQRLQTRKPEEDPFLGSTTDHTRQESADSGLGIAYSLPQTPEDFLSITNSDENMELSSGLTGEEELVPSIDEEISSELLDRLGEMQSFIAKENAMTWL